MAEMSGPLFEWLSEVIPQEAAMLHRQYHLVPAEDFAQELWVTAVRKREKLEPLIEQQEYGIARRRIKEGGFRLIREDDRYRRAIKAAAAGYRPQDEQFYNTGVLAQLVPMYLDNGVTESPPKGREMKIGTTAGGSSGEYLAMMLDLDWAMGRIKEYHRDILRRYFEWPQGSGGYTHAEIAGRLGIEPDRLRGRKDRALRALQNVLGGRNPWNRRALEYQDSQPEAAGIAA